MRFSGYMASRFYAVAAAALLAATLALVVRAVGGSVHVAALVVALTALALAACLATGFARSRRFFGELEDQVDRLDEPRLVTTLMPEAETPEEQVAVRVLSRVCKSASDEAAASRRQVEDYREYVETWVHEAKSPLAAAYLMLDNIAAEGGAAPDRVEALGEELGRIERYIDQALYYARSEAVEHDYLVRECDLHDLAAAAIKANARSLIAARVAPHLDGLEGAVVITDEKWMGFILGQIVQNSVKYARAEGAGIWFTARREGAGLADERIVLTVRDNGCGVSEADLPRVFEKGFTGKNGRTGKRSTGIGLYLVKRLCDKMALGVEAASREGEGFSVSISFPLSKMHYVDRG